MAQDTNIRTPNKVEEFGIYFEKHGRTPMAARVFSYLLLSEPPYKDFYDIQENLKASKSAISNALKELQREDVVDYITFSGDRRRYFKVHPKGWLNFMKKQIEDAPTLSNKLLEVLEERKDSKHLEFNEELKVMVDFFAFFSSRLSNIMEEWNNRPK